MKKSVKTQSTPRLFSYAEHASAWIRRGGIGVAMIALVLVGVNGFASPPPPSNCGPDKGILDFLKTAGGAWDKRCSSGLPGNASVGYIIGNVIQIILGFLGIIFLILTLYAGYMWMASEGEKEKVDTARKTLTAAVIGLIIVIAAQGVTYWVLYTLSQDVFNK